MNDTAGRTGLVLMGQAASLLLANGQTTEGTQRAVQRIATALRRPTRFDVRWGELTVWPDGDAPGLHQAVDPVAVDISRVVAAEAVVDQVCASRLDKAGALASLQAVSRMPPVSITRFAVMAAAGAAALGVIFGASDALTIAIIAAAAGAGALLRRGVSHVSRNPFAQPFLAALLAGAVASAATTLALPVSLGLIAVCPCMVLVPGPHFLNGMMDLARARMPLGAARVGFAGLVAVAISAGLLVGLSATTASIPEIEASPVPFAWDVCAAGVAVAAYGSFFNMSWSMVPVPICVGMLAHALRWWLLQAGASAAFGAFAACLLVGVIMTPVARRLRMPFGALAFAAVVSLIPGLLMFQSASAIVYLVDPRSEVTVPLLADVFRNGATAILVLLAMASGLVLPKLVLDTGWVLRRQA